MKFNLQLFGGSGASSGKGVGKKEWQKRYH